MHHRPGSLTSSDDEYTDTSTAHTPTHSSAFAAPRITKFNKPLHQVKDDKDDGNANANADADANANATRLLYVLVVSLYEITYAIYKWYVVHHIH